jgi:hypothetical protein
MALHACRITLVGIVFIPLSFATSFFGMNFEQLGAGTLHIGYFFLVAAISALIAWALSASIGPAERLWNRARRRFGEREYGMDDANGENYRWVTKKTVIWGWMRQHFSLAERLTNLWYQEKNKRMEECNEWFEERIPHFKSTVFWRFCASVVVKALSKLKPSVSLFLST